MQQPNVIFFDAVGTLFGVRGTVGEIYSTIASEMGVEISAEALDLAFFKSFKMASPLAFSEVYSMKIPELEYQWWYSLAKTTFAQVEALEKFSDFDVFFRQLYEYFATANPWFLYDDVIPVLKYWQSKEVELGIISNFDSRIYEVLGLFGLTDFFSSITISSMTGSAKPDSRIFDVALDKYNCHPHQAWHIGDSQKEDYDAAKTVGLQAFLLDRNVNKSTSFDIINTMNTLILI
ncbi:HAD-IA family hydrolase [Aphanothece sacrum]|uniref:Hydrolase n=1 Tax=Aphanothece sacrum FPU1 TaxID=1920663 RepID=A0A401IBQ9_APHSA|nr:HAD-IA family hydrolase [Aphanothece sacrum]GBF78660.1 hydrolase [Aphanothece sacrum FPU1]GBF84949.1 hydrolase [Aphanothece sacrum FPU3]